MLLTSVIALFTTAFTALLGRSFFSALAGGIFPADLLVGVLAAVLSAFRPRSLLAWVVFGALNAELFSDSPLGGGAAAVIVCAVTTRLLLFYVFTHSSRVARVTCASIGAATGMLIHGFYGFLSALLGSGAADSLFLSEQALHGILITMILTALCALILAFVLSLFDKNSVVRGESKISDQYAF
jgi:hypothetical protein